MTPVAALQATLEAEHAAVAVLAELGGRVSASADPRAASLLRAAYETHRGRRDHLVGLLLRAGETPVAPAPAYAVDSTDRSAQHLLTIAQGIERRCSVDYAAMVSDSIGARRRWAIGALADSSRRLLTLGGRATAFPGLPELS